MKKRTKDYPSRISRSACSTDKKNSIGVFACKDSPEENLSNNLLFVNGVRELEVIINRLMEAVSLKQRVLGEEKHSLHPKRVNGHEYLYLWMDGKWKSKGRVCPGEDYKTTLEHKIASLNDEKELIKKEVKLIVVSKIGDGHLIINSKKHLDRNHDIIPLKKIYPFLDLDLEISPDKKGRGDK